MNETAVLEFWDENEKRWKRAGKFQQDRDLERRTKVRLVILTNAANRHE